jgi:hypothetical protein
MSSEQRDAREGDDVARYARRYMHAQGMHTAIPMPPAPPASPVFRSRAAFDVSAQRRRAQQRRSAAQPPSVASAAAPSQENDPTLMFPPAPMDSEISANETQRE